MNSSPYSNHPPESRRPSIWINLHRAFLTLTHQRWRFIRFPIPGTSFQQCIHSTNILSSNSTRPFKKIATFSGDLRHPKMQPSFIVLLLLLIIAAASAAPPHHQAHFSIHRLRNSLQPPVPPPQPKEDFEVVRPLPTDALTPTCTLPVLSHSFGNTIGLPPTNATYSSPSNCTWSSAVLHLSGAANGSQYDRIAAVWLSGVEILRTSTPEPTPEGIFWNVRKDITKYSSILRKSNLTLAVMLENVVNDVYTAVYRVNLTFLFYNNASTNAIRLPSSALPLDPESTVRKLGENANPAPINLKGFKELNENPADLIIPISTSGEEGYWFKIQSESDSVFHGIKLPLNTYRAVVEVYVSAHGDDEFWYSNPPDSYFEINNLTNTRGHGSYREVRVKLDDNIVGIVVPFPVIFTGGINPLFWDPVVSIAAFNLPSYEIELTPFLAMLLDGQQHYFGLGVSEAIPFWLVDANLHLWLDDKVAVVQAGAVKFSGPTSCVDRVSKFSKLDGKFEIEGESESEFNGWVNYSAGNISVHVKRKVEYESSIKFEGNGNKKEVEVEVGEKIEFNLKYSDSGVKISSSEVKRTYPLEITTTTEVGSGPDIYLMETKLKQSVEESKVEGPSSKSSVINTQKCKGWMIVQDHDVLSGAATTEQTYTAKDSGCYKRQVSAAGGVVESDSENFICAAPAAGSTILAILGFID